MSGMPPIIMQVRRRELSRRWKGSSMGYHVKVSVGYLVSGNWLFGSSMFGIICANVMYG